MFCIVAGGGVNMLWDFELIERERARVSDYEWEIKLVLGHMRKDILTYFHTATDPTITTAPVPWKEGLEITKQHWK